MPVRSLNSVVLKWPSREEALSAARRWAEARRAADPSIRHIFCVGSGARGDWGVGSDLDIIMVIDDIVLSLVDRRRRYEPEGLPVPADLWVFTQSEWDAFLSQRAHLRNRWEECRIELAG